MNNKPKPPEQTDFLQDLIMHTIQHLLRPRRPTAGYMGFYAVYHDGPKINGRCLAADPITAYHGAVLAALKNHEREQPPN